MALNYTCNKKDRNHSQRRASATIFFCCCFLLISDFFIFQSVLFHFSEVLFVKMTIILCEISIFGLGWKGRHGVKNGPFESDPASMFFISYFFMFAFFLVPIFSGKCFPRSSRCETFLCHTVVVVIASVVGLVGVGVGVGAGAGAGVAVVVVVVMNVH